MTIMASYLSWKRIWNLSHQTVKNALRQRKVVNSERMILNCGRGVRGIFKATLKQESLTDEYEIILSGYHTYCPFKVLCLTENSQGTMRWFLPDYIFKVSNGRDETLVMCHPNCIPDKVTFIFIQITADEYRENKHMYSPLRILMQTATGREYFDRGYHRNEDFFKTLKLHWDVIVGYEVVRERVQLEEQEHQTDSIVVFRASNGDSVTVSKRFVLENSDFLKMLERNGRVPEIAADQMIQFVKTPQFASLDTLLVLKEFFVYRYLSPKSISYLMENLPEVFAILEFADYLRSENLCVWMRGLIYVGMVNSRLGKESFLAAYTECSKYPSLAYIVERAKPYLVSVLNVDGAIWKDLKSKRPELFQELKHLAFTSSTADSLLTFSPWTWTFD